MIREYPVEDATDAELIGRYVDGRDQRAFEVLIGRHASMVMATVSKVLRKAHDAEDAFQATFMTLAKAADGIRCRAALGAWLHRTAQRCAMLISQDNARRAKGRKEMVDYIESPQFVDRSVAGHSPSHKAANDELREIIDGEIKRLPQNQQRAIFLCDIQGLTRTQAAKQLGLPVATLTLHVSKARVSLAHQLRQRGITLAVASLMAYFRAATNACAIVPTEFIRATATNSVMYATGKTPTKIPSAAISTANLLVSKMSKARRTAFFLAAVGILAFAGVLVNSLGLPGMDNVADAQSFFDDFEDGDASDGKPVTWTVNPDSDGLSRVVSGSLIVSGDDDATGNELVGVHASDIIFDDVSVETQATLNGQGMMGILLRGSNNRGYIGALDHDGVATIWKESNSFSSLARATVTNIDTEAPVKLRFEAVGPNLSLTIWQGDEKPQSPTIAAENDEYHNGIIGVALAEISPDVTIAFHDVRATAIPEPTTAALSFAGFLSLLAAGRKWTSI